MKLEIEVLELAEKQCKINKGESFMISEMLHDIECVKRFGINGHIFKGGILLELLKNI